MKVPKPVRLLPKLYNIQPFLNQDHPVLHPEGVKYHQYWTEQARRSIEGLWGKDMNDDSEGGWRYMPGPLYFYINIGKIELQTKRGREIVDHPKLRDTDWIISYYLSAAEGFSGFEDDDEYTCHRLVKKIQNEKELTPQEEYDLKEFKDELVNPNTGEYKEYVPALDYLHMTHDKPKGQALWRNEFLDSMILSSRRVGKSYFIAIGEVLHEFIFNGAKRLEDFDPHDMSPSTIVVGAAQSDFSEELLDKFDANYNNHLYDGMGAYKESSDEEEHENGFFYHPTSGSLRAGYTYTNKVKRSRGGGTEGLGTKIVHAALGNKGSHKSVGYGARKVIIEEAGLLDDFEKFYGLSSMTKERERKIGRTTYIGTGGESDKIQQIKKAFLNPLKYEVYPYEDKWKASKKGLTGLFIPSYYRKHTFKDENGNTIFEDAIRQDVADLEKKRSEGDMQAYQNRKQGFPLELRDMFLESGSNIFPTTKLEAREEELANKPIRSRADVGYLQYTGNDKKHVEFRPDVKETMTPIVEYGDEDSLDTKTSAWIIYEHPSEMHKLMERHKTPFRVSYDPVRDPGEGSSICSVYVYKDWDFDNPGKVQNNIVAEMHFRYDNTEDRHEEALMAAGYWNCLLMPETNNPDILTYSAKQGKWDWLANEPKLATEGKLKIGSKNDKGIYIVPKSKPHIEELVKDKFEEEVDREEWIEGDEYKVRTVEWLEQCQSIRLIQEALAYRTEGNFDAMSAFMVMVIWMRADLDIEGRIDRTIEDKKKSDELKSKILGGSREPVQYESRKSFY